MLFKHFHEFSLNFLKLLSFLKLLGWDFNDFQVCSRVIKLFKCLEIFFKFFVQVLGECAAEMKTNCCECGVLS